MEGLILSLLLATVVLLGLYCWHLHDALRFERETRDYIAGISALYAYAEWLRELRRPVEREHVMAYLEREYGPEDAEPGDKDG